MTKVAVAPVVGVGVGKGWVGSRVRGGMREIRHHQDIQTLQQTHFFVTSRGKQYQIKRGGAGPPRSKTDISSLAAALTSETVDFQQTRAKQRQMWLLGVEDSSQDAED